MLRNTLFITLFSTLFVLNGCGAGSSASTSSQTSTQFSQTSTSSSDSVSTQEDPKNTSITATTNNEVLKTIDLLVLVDKNDENNLNGINETKIDHYIAVTNQIYKNSGLAVKLNIKKIQLYTFSDKTSDETLFDTYNDKNITQIRNNINADLVITYRKYANDGHCGVAYVNYTLSADIGYAHVSFDCGSTTTAHEIGHTMGLTHSQQNTKKAGLFNYARGYGLDDEFVTVMGYKSTFHTNSQKFNYSSPNLDCNGFECGIDSELVNGADAVKALKYAIDYVADFR